jgi:hypothetical protein
MRVTHSERDGLTRIRLRPVKLPAYWGFGGVFLAAGLLAGLVGGRMSLVDCSRDTSGTARCRLESKSLAGHARVDGELTSALPRDSLTWGFVANREVFVTVKGRELPLGLVAAGGDEKDDLARRLNLLVSGEGPDVRYREDTRLAFWFLGFFVAASGAAILLSIEFVSVTVDRESQQVTIRRVSGWRRRRETVPLDRIAGVHSEAFTFRRATSFNVVFDLVGRKPLHIARTPLFTEASARTVLELIQKDVAQRA